MAKDRTAEFHNTLLSIKSRSVAPQNGSAGRGRDAEAKQSLLGNNAASSSKPKGKGKDEGGAKSEFGRLAAGIAKDINATTLKLQKLAQRESTAHAGGSACLSQWPSARHYSTTAPSKSPS